MSKLPHIGTTIFTTMSKMALEHNAINLSQGFPNFPVDEQLLTLLEGAVRENTHQYAPMPGNTMLLEQVANLTLNMYGRKTDPQENVLITAGATQAIFTTIHALVSSGEEVIILDPSYDCYDPAIVLAGAKPVHINMLEDYTPDWDKIRSSVSEKTKMIIINNPHNPSGKTLTEGDIRELEYLMEDFPQLLLLSDEVYEYITFEEKHISANTRPLLAERAVVVSSFGKTFHITGWKTGYIIAPAYLMKELKKVHQFLVFSVNSVAQTALARYLEIVDVRKLGAFYQEKRDFFRNKISSSRFNLLPSQGSYFQTVSYEGISDEPDVDFVQRLVKDHGVAAIPFSVFYQDKTDLKRIRFCFAKDDETLEKAGELLCRI